MIEADSEVLRFSASLAALLWAPVAHAHSVGPLPAIKETIEKSRISVCNLQAILSINGEVSKETIRFDYISNLNSPISAFLFVTNK